MVRIGKRNRQDTKDAKFLKEAELLLHGFTFFLGALGVLAVQTLPFP